MIWLMRRLHVPASESQMAVVLALSATMMGLMFWAIIWQSSVIADQREVIRWLSRGLHVGG